MEENKINAVKAEAPKKNRKKFHDLILYTLIMAFLITLAGQLLGDGLTKWIGRHTSSDMVITCLEYFMTIGVWIVGLLVMWLIKRNRFMLPKLTAAREGNTLKMLLIGIAIGFGGNMICVIAALLNRNIYIHFDSFRPLSLLLAFFCVFVQSSSEELVCRLYCQEKILKNFRPIFAILPVALFFASMHLFNPGMRVIPFLNILLVGVFYGLMVYYFDSLWCAFGMHAAWNFTQNILMGLPNSGIVTSFSMFKLDAATATSSWAYDAGFGVEGSVTSLVIHVIAIALLWYFMHDRKPSLFAKPGKEEAPAEEKN